MGTFLILLVLLFLGIAVFMGVSIQRTPVAAGSSRKNTNIQIHPLKPLPFIGLALIAFTIFLCFVTVDAGSIGVVKKFGQPVSQILPGAHLILPWEDVSPVAVQTRIVKPDTQSSTHDLQVVHTQVTLQYHVDPQYATFVLVNLNNEAETRIIDPAILEAIKAATAKYDAQQLISQRTEVRDYIESLVKARISPYHLIAENISITDLDFSKDYNDTIEQKQVAQQNAEKAANDLKRIQIEAQEKIAAAEGEAQALKSQKEQITPELLQLRTIEMMSEKWDGKLPDNYVSTGGAGGALPMFDVLAGNRKKVMNVYTSAANVVSTTCAYALCADLSCIPDEALSRAISETSDSFNYVHFVSRADGSNKYVAKQNVLEEMANRKLRNEVKEVKFYDKSFIDSLKYQTPYHPITKWSNIIPSSGLGASQHEEGMKEELKLVDKIFRFFDKFSIKFVGGKVERVVESSENSNASDVCKEG